MYTSLDIHQAKKLSDFLMSLQKESEPLQEETPVEPDKLDFFRTITANYSCVRAKVKPIECILVTIKGGTLFTVADIQ